MVLNTSIQPKMTTNDGRLQSRKPQVIGAIHEQSLPRSENPWILGSSSCAEVRQCEAARVGRYAPTPRQQAAACRQAPLVSAPLRLDAPAPKAEATTRITGTVRLVSAPSLVAQSRVPGARMDPM